MRRSPYGKLKMIMQESIEGWRGKIEKNGLFIRQFFEIRASS